MLRHRHFTDFESVFSEVLLNENARVTAIVGGAMIDNYLTLAILARMRPIGNTMHEDLFEGYGPLSTFSAKIDIGFAINLYNDGARHDLRIINTIRNQFAHNLYVREFTETKIRDLCFRLRAPEVLSTDQTTTQPRENARDRFRFTALILLGGLHDLSRIENHRPMPLSAPHAGQYPWASRLYYRMSPDNGEPDPWQSILDERRPPSTQTVGRRRRGRTRQPPPSQE
jgi:hypothetical protein